MKTNQKYLSQEQFFELFDTFIKESINGKRLNPNMQIFLCGIGIGRK